MESSSDQQVYKPSEAEQTLISKHLGTHGVIVDAHFKGTSILKETQARRRAELVSDIDYVFSLALKHGDYYLGQAEILFELKQMPENDEELFLNSQAMAVAELRINEHHITEESGFKN